MINYQTNQYIVFTQTATPSASAGAVSNSKSEVPVIAVTVIVTFVGVSLIAVLLHFRTRSLIKLNKNLLRSQSGYLYKSDGNGDVAGIRPRNWANRVFDAATIASESHTIYSNKLNGVNGRRNDPARTNGQYGRSENEGQPHIEPFVLPEISEFSPRTGFPEKALGVPGQSRIDSRFLPDISEFPPRTKFKPDKALGAVVTTH